MFEIPKEIKEDVTKIIEYLIAFNNEKKLSWLQVYKETLKKLNLEDKVNDNILLSSTVKQLTNQGYDIIGEPFKLERFK